MNKQERSERLYDITQLAKAIFIELAKDCNFAELFPMQKESIINSSFAAAEAFFEHQEAYALQNK